MSIPPTPGMPKPQLKSMNMQTNEFVFHVQGILCHENVSRQDLLKASKILRPIDYDDVVEEREAKYMCAYPTCPKKLTKTPYRDTFELNLDTKEFASTRSKHSYCSTECYNLSTNYRNSLSDESIASRELLLQVAKTEEKPTKEQLKAHAKILKEKMRAKRDAIRKAKANNIDEDGTPAVESDVGVTRKVKKSNLKKRKKNVVVDPTSLHVVEHERVKVVHPVEDDQDTHDTQSQPQSQLQPQPQPQPQPQSQSQKSILHKSQNQTNENNIQGKIVQTQNITSTEPSSVVEDAKPSSKRSVNFGDIEERSYYKGSRTDEFSDKSGNQVQSSTTPTSNTPESEHCHWEDETEIYSDDDKLTKKSKRKLLHRISRLKQFGYYSKNMSSSSMDAYEYMLRKTKPELFDNDIDFDIDSDSDDNQNEFITEIDDEECGIKSPAEVGTDVSTDAKDVESLSELHKMHDMIFGTQVNSTIDQVDLMPIENDDIIQETTTTTNSTDNTDNTDNTENTDNTSTPINASSEQPFQSTSPDDLILDLAELDIYDETDEIREKLKIERKNAANSGDMIQRTKRKIKSNIQTQDNTRPDIQAREENISVVDENEHEDIENIVVIATPTVEEILAFNRKTIPTSADVTPDVTDVTDVADVTDVTPGQKNLDTVDDTQLEVKMEQKLLPSQELYQKIINDTERRRTMRRIVRRFGGESHINPHRAPDSDTSESEYEGDFDALALGPEAKQVLNDYRAEHMNNSTATTTATSTTTDTITDTATSTTTNNSITLSSIEKGKLKQLLREADDSLNALVKSAGPRLRGLPPFSQVISTLLSMITDETYHKLNVTRFVEAEQKKIHRRLNASANNIDDDNIIENHTDTPALGDFQDARIRTLLNVINQQIILLQKRFSDGKDGIRLYSLPRRISELIDTFSIPQSLYPLNQNMWKFFALSLVKVLAAFDEECFNRLYPDLAKSLTIKDKIQQFPDYFWFFSYKDTTTEGVSENDPLGVLEKYVRELGFTIEHLNSVPMSFVRD